MPWKEKGGMGYACGAYRTGKAGGFRPLSVLLHTVPPSVGFLRSNRPVYEAGDDDPELPGRLGNNAEGLIQLMNEPLLP